MLGSSTLTRASGSASNNRVFVYEVTGLRQNTQTENSTYPVRNSGSVFIQVPYSRMNEEMRRISRLGGQIVSIHSSSDNQAQAKAAPAEAAPAEA